MRLVSRIVSKVAPPALTLSLFARKQLRRGEAELKLLPTLVDPKRPSVDAGANLGVYSYWLSRLSSKVFAFEPHPAMAQFLRRARLKNVEVHQVALSDAEGEATLHVPKFDGLHGSAGHGSIGQQFEGTAVEQIRVPLRRLDDVIGTSDVGFVKIDVEGHELAMLAGAAGTFARCRPTLLVEIEQSNYPDRPVIDVIRQFEASGNYQSFYLAPGGLRPAEEAPVKKEWQMPGPEHTVNFIFRPA
jgi:FkbM family methyltransferase